MNKLILTGASGVGKSTLLSKIPAGVPHMAVRGTYSQVLYQGQVRMGWRLHNFHGEGGVLAHLDIQSDYKLGRYGVDMSLFHRVMMPELEIDESVDLYLIDEIGAIAPWSDRFITAMDALLDSDRRVISIVSLNPRHPYPESVKVRADIELWEITKDNRDSISDDVLNWIKSEE